MRLAFACLVFRLCLSTCPDCCTQAGDEALFACKEYELMTAELDCEVWRQAAQETCLATCGSCIDIAMVLKTVCEDTMAGKANSAQVRANCEITKLNYQTLRCPSVCEPLGIECVMTDAIECQFCGNWQDCQCFSPFGSDMTICSGTSVRSGIISACGKMPAACYHHVISTCGKFRTCNKNMCVIHDVKCEVENVCHKMSTCLPSSGDCRPIFYENGYPCATGLFYVISDSGKCQNGECVGIVNECCKHNVKCVVDSPCVKSVCDPLSQDCTCSLCASEDHPDYVCDPLCDVSSGVCTFQLEPDGTRCTTNRYWIDNEVCSDGICTGTEIDLCMDMDIDCSFPPVCRLPGICESHLGECVYPPIDNEPCNDQASGTFHDVCVEGFCRSSYFEYPEFDELGEGTCSDASGRSLTQFHANNFTMTACQSECSADVACEAFSWSMFAHTCILYSRIRVERGGWAIESPASELAEVGEIVSVEASRPGGPSKLCWKKVLLRKRVILNHLTGRQQFYLVTSALFLSVIGIAACTYRQTVRNVLKFLCKELYVESTAVVIRRSRSQNSIMSLTGSPKMRVSKVSPELTKPVAVDTTKKLDDTRPHDAKPHVDEDVEEEVLD